MIKKLNSALTEARNIISYNDHSNESYAEAFGYLEVIIEMLINQKKGGGNNGARTNASSKGSFS